MRKIILALIIFCTAVLFGCDEKNVKTEDECVGHIHLYNEQYMTATCTECGRIIYTCTECGDTFETVIPPNGHEMEYINGVAPTCTRAGFATYERCTACDYSTYRELPINQNNHNPEIISICVESNTDLCECAVKCKDCGKEYTTHITSELIGTPILYLNGSTAGLSKENKVTIKAEYDGGKIHFKSDATLKIQGATSSGMEKKNYNIKFVNGDTGRKVMLVESWGSHSKYCLKANYVDCTQARNVVSGKIYGQIAESRNLDDEYSKLVNGGATDGFPICVYLNGEFLGLYTMNIPKDEWMFGMDGEGRQAIIKAASWTDSVQLKQHIEYDFSNGWDMVYCSTDDTKWAVDSFNKMMDFVNNNSGSSFKRYLRKYINVERAIDTYIFTVLMHANDNLSKNIIWTTYDGKIWAPTVYDMDDSWGLVWNGMEYYSPTDMDFSTYTNRLWNKMSTEFSDEIKARYKELRETVFTVDNIGAQFDRFINSIPKVLYAAEAEKWKNVPSRDTNNLSQILKFVRYRLKYLDSQMK